PGLDPEELGLGLEEIRRPAQLTARVDDHVGEALRDRAILRQPLAVRADGGEEPVALAALLPLVVEAEDDAERAFREQLADHALVDRERVDLLALEERHERRRRSRHRLEVALEVEPAARGDDLAAAVGAGHLVEDADLLP